MFKFYGEKRKVINSVNGGVAFRFDNKGEFVTDDELLIERAKKKFDYAEIKVESVGEKVIVDKPDISIKITTKEKETNEVQKLKCKQCDFETDNNGVLLTHYRREHRKE